MSEDNKTEATPEGTSSPEDFQRLSEKYKNDYLYLRAEFENYKRNAIKERSELIKYGAERLVVEMLGVLDNFDRALEVPPRPETLQDYAKGVELTSKEFRTALQKLGVQELPALGLAFDPNSHEALGSEPTNEFTSGFVCRVLKKPYKLHDKLIRPGQVIVAQPLKPENNA